MDTFQSIEADDASSEGMARSKKAAGVKLSPAASSALARLKGAVSNRPAFDAVVAEIEAASDLPTEQVIEVAERFAIPSRKPTSRKAAMAAINKRFVELARFREKNERAAKTKPW